MIMKGEGESVEEMRNWSELPRNVMSVIARRLTVGTDRVRFSEVCRNWSSVAKSEINYLPCSPPWLMQEIGNGTNFHLFTSVGRMLTFELDLPEMGLSLCVGSNGCWIFMIDQAWNLYLLNPLSRARIDLPWFFGFDDKDEEKDSVFQARKVVLSFLNSDSASDLDFVAMTIWNDSRGLAYTRKGANSWQALACPGCSFVDILFFNGRFYVLDSRGTLFKCLGGCSPHKPVRVSDGLEEFYSGEFHYEVERYLVQIDGMILQVIHIEWGDKEYKRAKFCAYIFNHIAGRWVETNHLSNHSVFLGSNTSVGILSSSSVNLKPNFIYLTGYFDVFVAHYLNSVFAPCDTSDWPVTTSWVVPTMLSVRRVPNSLSDEEMRNWSELPRNLLRVIARQLTVGTDRVRFSEVCRNWSSVAKSMRSYFPCCPPWMILNKKHESGSLCLFSSACGNQSFKLDFPEIRKSACVGSAGCWVVMVDQAWNLYLLNPLSRAKIDLPNVCAYANDGQYSETDLVFLVEFEAEKVVLSFLDSESVSGSDFVAMVIFDEASRIAYTKKGEKSWQVLASPPCSFVDILYFNGQFYALDSRGILFKCLVGCNPHTLVQVSTELEESYFEDDCEIQERYLVQIHCQIMQVVKIKWIDPEDPTWDFRVLIYPPCFCGWVETHLRGHSLFLGHKTSVAVLSSSSVELQPNCIYTECRNGGFYGPDDSIDVINYYTGRFSISRLDPIYSISWIVPTSLSVRRILPSLSDKDGRNWSELPRDVLRVIARQLKVGLDRVRFSEVCRNWSTVAKSESNYLPCTPPWLLHVKPKTSLCLFLGANKMQKFELDFPEMRKNLCVGSTGCWIVMRNRDYGSNLVILNPVSRARINLPNVYAYDYDCEYSEDPFVEEEFKPEKVVFSFLDSDSNSGSDSDANANSNPNFVAMAIIRFERGRGNWLAYTRKGANFWEPLQYHPYSFVDILYFNGQFYALDDHGTLCKCLVDCNPHTLVEVSDELRFIIFKHKDAYFDGRYLVKISSSIILQVVKIINWIDKGKDQKLEFRVFIFDHIAGEWEETYHLGEYSLFIGEKTSSVAISSRSSINLKPNCIYFYDYLNKLVVYDLGEPTDATLYANDVVL